MKTSTLLLIGGGVAVAAYAVYSAGQSSNQPGWITQIGGAVSGVIGALKGKGAAASTSPSATNAGTDTSQANTGVTADNGAAISDGMGVAAARSQTPMREGYMNRAQVAQIGGISYSQFSTAVH